MMSPDIPLGDSLQKEMFNIFDFCTELSEVCDQIGEITNPIKMNLGIVGHAAGFVEELEGEEEIVFTVKKRTQTPEPVQCQMILAALKTVKDDIKRIKDIVKFRRSYFYEGLCVIHQPDKVIIEVRWTS